MSNTIVNSFINPKHTYLAIVCNVRNPEVKDVSAGVNGRRWKGPANVSTKIPGWAILQFQYATIDRPIMGVDEDSGMPEIKGYQKTPRFAVTVSRDITASAEQVLPPIPAGGVQLKAPKREQKEEGKQLFKGQDFEDASDAGPEEEPETGEPAAEEQGDLSAKTRDELREIAKTLGVAGCTAMSKADLVKNIELLS